MSQEQQDNAPLTAGFLMQVFASFQKQLDANLDQRFAAVEAKIDGRITGLRDEMIERFKTQREEMIERIEDSETRLLKEFRKWAVRIESSGRVYEARSFGLDQRVAVLEERVNELEEPRRN